MFVDLHDSSLVAATVAIVGSTEDGDHVLIVTPVVTLHDQLVSARDERQPVMVIELLGNVLTKRVAGPAR